MGKPLIFYCLKGIERIKKIKEVLIVQSPERDVEECIKDFKFDFKIKFLIQKKSRWEWEMPYFRQEIF
jgi:NDP-sugar pyrophosphorylase family protein